jgi:MFS superfamily sulfate permease-like transporter
VQQQPGTVIVVIDCSTTPNIDLAACRMLRDLHDQLEKDGVAFELAEVHGYVRDLLRTEMLQDRIAGVEQRLGIAELLSRRKGLAESA